MKRNPIFGQKPWTKPLEKCRSWHFLTVQFSDQKIIFFHPQDQKTIFTDLFYPKEINNKKYDFWTKTVDSPLWQISLFCTF